MLSEVVRENPKAKLRDQLPEVMRFKQLSPTQKPQLMCELS
jgi:hypothetical protein